MSTTTATPSFPSPASPTPTLEFVPPAVESLDFGKNCTLAGLWVVSSHVEFQATLDYIQQALPPDLNPPLTEYQTFEWFIYDSIYGNGTLYTSMYEYAVWNCTDEVCRDLDWEGNADLAGIGMVFTYYFEAMFATIYFAVLIAEKYKRKNSGPAWKLRFSFIGAFRDSLDGFLDGAALFAMSMLVASVFENAYNARNFGVDTTTYSTLLSMLLPIYCLFPIALLQSVSQGRRRMWLRRSVWIILIIQAIAVCILGAVTFRYLTDNFEPDFYTPRSPQQSFEKHCAPKESEFSVRPAFKAAGVVFTVCVVFWFVFVINVPGIPAVRDSVVLKKIRSLWWIVVASLSFIGMWTYLVLFTIYRSIIVDKAGISQQDTRWSFGQVLALATWAPVAIDFAYIYVFGSQHGLEGRVARPWVVGLDPALALSNGQSKSLDKIPLMNPAGDSETVDYPLQPRGNV